MSRRCTSSLSITPVDSVAAGSRSVYAVSLKPHPPQSHGSIAIVSMCPHNAEMMIEFDDWTLCELAADRGKFVWLRWRTRRGRPRERSCR